MEVSARLLFHRSPRVTRHKRASLFAVVAFSAFRFTFLLVADDGSRMECTAVRTTRNVLSKVVMNNAIMRELKSTYNSKRTVPPLLIGLVDLYGLRLLFTFTFLLRRTLTPLRRALALLLRILALQRQHVIEAPCHI